MKVVKFKDLKTITHKDPLYIVLNDEVITDGDPRALDCGQNGLLNFKRMVKSRMGICAKQTAYEIWMNEISPKIPLEYAKGGIPFSVILNFVETDPELNGWRCLVVNPSATNPEIFWKIALNRLSLGDVVLMILEVPNQSGVEAVNKLNHISVLSCDEDGDICYDGLKTNVETLSNILWFSPINTLLFYAPPVKQGNQNGQQ